MSVEMVNPRGVPAPVGMYHHASRTGHPKEMVFVAGQVGVDDGGKAAPDFPTQMKQVYRNIERVLEGLDLSLADVAKLTTYVTSPDLIGPFYDVRAEIYPSLFPTGAHPPNTLLVVSRLVRPEFQIEIEAVAVRS